MILIPSCFKSRNQSKIQAKRHSNLSHFTIITYLYVWFQGVTPTTNNPWIGGMTGSKPPTGWILAGFLILLLIGMLYQQIKRFILKKFKRAKR